MVKEKSSREVLENFFENWTKKSESVASAYQVVFREDGIILYERGKQDLGKEVGTSLGALLAGAWQATQQAHTLVATSQDQSLYQEFRLSFDTSSSGIYLLPIHSQSRGRLFLGALYKQEANPGRLKRDLRLLANEITICLDSLGSMETSQDLSQDLSSITEEEIDALFEFKGTTCHL